MRASLRIHGPYNAVKNTAVAIPCMVSKGNAAAYTTSAWPMDCGWKKAHDAPNVEHQPVDVSRQETPDDQGDEPERGLGETAARKRSVRLVRLNPNEAEHLAHAVESAERRQNPAEVADKAPAVHLPRGPRSLPEEEVRHERRQSPHHETTAPAESGACDDGDSGHRLEAETARTECARCGGAASTTTGIVSRRRGALSRNSRRTASATPPPPRCSEGPPGRRPTPRTRQAHRAPPRWRRAPQLR